MMDIPACLANILTTPPPPAYRVVTLAGNGTVLGSLPILVGDDEQGRERAKSMVNGHAVELWDRPALHRVLPAAHVTAALRTVPRDGRGNGRPRLRLLLEAAVAARGVRDADR